MCPCRLLGDAGHLMGSTVNELLPPDAQIHLLNAQRELLIAVKLTIEHHRRQRAAADGGGARRRPVRVEVE
jgi:hypothetical protein